MLGNGNKNPIADAIDQSSAHGDTDTNAYQGSEYRAYLHENDLLRQNEVRQSFEFSQMNSTLDCLKRWTL